MLYEPIPPPFGDRYNYMEKKELRAYYRWFIESIPLGVGELAGLVNATSGFERWRPDFTPESLEPLGEWYAGQVEMRPRTEDEMRAMTAGQKYPIEVSTEELTDKTFSLAVDIGMYFSQVWLRNHPTLTWMQRFSGKLSVDYGQPILAGFGRLQFNPVRMMVTHAYALARHSRSGNGLRQIYDVWVDRYLAPAE